MWMVNPKLLCRAHLFGEHNELHKHRHDFVKKHSVKGRIQNNGIEPSSMEKRHDSLAKEMRRRGYKHASPYKMPDLSYLPEKERNYKVDVEASKKDLIKRCKKCRQRTAQK